MTSTISKDSCLFLFELQLASRLVFIEKRAQLRSSVEQSNPLLVIESDREAAKPVDAHSTFFTDLELKLAGATSARLFFQFSDSCFELFVRWFGHFFPLSIPRRIIPLRLQCPEGFRLAPRR